MLNTIAKILTNYLIERNIVEKEKVNIMIYGFELFISMLCSIVSIFILGIFLNKILVTLIFLIWFISIRLVAGGFHAKTYLSCFFLTNSVYIFYLIASEVWRKMSIITFFCVAVAICYIWIKAPVIHINHCISEQSAAQNRMSAHFLLVLTVLLIMLFYKLDYTSVANAVCLTVMIDAIMMGIANIRR